MFNLEKIIFIISGFIAAAWLLFNKGMEKQKDNQRAKEVKEDYENLLKNNKIKKEVASEIRSKSFTAKSNILFHKRDSKSEK